jgi:hypothetical protein
LSRIDKRKNIPSIVELDEVLNDLCDQLRDDVFEKYVEEYIARKRPKRAGDAIKYAKQKVEAAWTSVEGKIAIVGGKDLISRLSTWSQSTFGVGIGVSSLLRSLSRDDLQDEVVSIINAIERNRSFI